MTNREAIDAFVKKFGGFPYHSFLGVPPEGKSERLIDFVERSLEAGEIVDLPEDEEGVLR